MSEPLLFGMPRKKGLLWAAVLFLGFLPGVFVGCMVPYLAAVLLIMGLGGMGGGIMFGYSLPSLFALSHVVWLGLIIFTVIRLKKRGIQKFPIAAIFTGIFCGALLLPVALLLVIPFL